MKESALENSAMIDEDIQNIQATINGQSEAFDRLVLKYQHSIYQLCYRVLGDLADAEDCAQDTFVKAYYGLKHFKFQAQFSTWLYRIAVNTCKNKQKSLEFRWRNMLTRLDRGRETDDGVSYLEIRDKTAGPSEILEQSETGKAIINAVNMLPPEQRLLIYLCDFEGRTYEEIVEITGIKLGTVKSKLARARGKLREKLAGVVNE